ncbi:hypothetical protein [Granulosicoccus antarcticus]|uniref:Uncharacterized protein n=1 Tax=Granulosicoccus antarcticus IMCC3135 TaxID=1192854 RepID=A0A2Z2P2L6_9GAMM|nr:hypothetical protein [Granulosicoccus antarcticus]ASJ74807.1 hypothetical protein IMCC3135_23690 [Granulosicoccus antarcticus IMCC3135]
MSEMRDGRQFDWDQLRFKILVDVASVQLPESLQWRRVAVALARAYDGPLPAYGVYRQLRAFAVARWPQLNKLVVNGTLSDELADEVITVLDASVSARQAGETDALEVEMALLRELLDGDRG